MAGPSFTDVEIIFSVSTRDFQALIFIVVFDTFPIKVLEVAVRMNGG